MNTERYVVKVYHDDGVHSPFESNKYLVYSSDELVRFLKSLEKDLKSARKSLRKQYIKSTILVSAVSGFKKVWEYTKEISYRD